MDKRTLVVGVVVLIVVVLGFALISNMTGNVITGSVVKGSVVENELFRIDDFGMRINETEDVNGSQNSSGSG